MTTPTQQDLIDHFTLRTEELRRVPGLRGPARLLHNLFLDLFLSIIRLLASLAERARAGTLPDTAPAPQAGASPRPAGTPASPRAWPSDPWPSPNRCLEHRAPEAACGGSTMHAPCEQPEPHEPIAEPPCRMPEVQLPAASPRPAHIRTSEAGVLRLFSKKLALAHRNFHAHFVSI